MKTSEHRSTANHAVSWRWGIRLAGKCVALQAAAGLLAGCAAVGSDYIAPDSAAPASWQGAVAARVVVAPASPTELASWWRQLNDPALSGLIEQAPVSYTHLDVYKRQMYVSSMLHFELYEGSGSGPLTVRSNPPYQRRSDLIEPADYLDGCTLRATPP